MSKISGVLDYDPQALATLARVEDAFMGVFRAYGYARIAPPILQSADVFLERSGEEIRRRLYLINDSGGRSLCLRPELTIPACLFYLRHARADAGPTRLSYAGPVFRYESPGRGRYRQFNQAGVELIGGGDTVAADAEIVALAVNAAERQGLAALRLKVGDVSLFERFVEGLPISESWRNRVRQRYWYSSSFEAMLKELTEKRVAAAEPQFEDSTFADALATLGTERAAALIEEVLTLAGIPQVGGRSISEIATRFIQDASDERGGEISGEIIDLIRRFLSIQGPLDRCIQELGGLAKDAGVSLESVLSDMSRRLAIVDGYGFAPDEVVFDTSFRRTLQYYTGFVFELHAPALGANTQICGGGRYDHLLSQLGAATEIPAIGCAFGMERFALAHDASSLAGDGAAPSPIDAIVVAAGDVAAVDCAKAARQLREGGWNVRLEVSGRRPRKILREASREAVPYMVFVGEDEIARQCVKIRDLANRIEREIPMGALTDFAAGRMELSLEQG